MKNAAEEAVAELGLDKYAAIFVGDYVGGQDLSTLLYESWDLAEIDRRYEEFTERFQTEADRLDRGVVEPAQAFVIYLVVIDHWRKLPFRDPGLPSDCWASTGRHRRRGRSSRSSSALWTVEHWPTPPVTGPQVPAGSRDSWRS
nr:PaaX family transcriptional regulator C-terminal domain-containing protein [Kribbella speibonae]